MSEQSLHTEKRILAIAVSFCVVMLVLLAFASYRYGITVPGCLEDVKPFQKGELIKKADKHYELHVVAKMWAFEPSYIEVPVGSKLDIFLSSLDVNHGFHINGTNVNLSAVPGVVNYASLEVLKEGKYSIVCHEYCGLAHHAMYGELHVKADIEEARIDQLQQSQQPSPETSEPHGESVAQEPIDVNDALVQQGQKVFQDKICMTCHSLDGAQAIGPTFKGLFGSQVTLSDGSTVLADEAYIIESIREPQKRIVKGYENVPMPPLPISDEEMQALVELIKSVR